MSFYVFSESEELITKHLKQHFIYPTGRELLIKLYKAGEKTKGGIILTDNVQERDAAMTNLGVVLAMGPYAYNRRENNHDLFHEGPYCKVGDTILFATNEVTRLWVTPEGFSEAIGVGLLKDAAVRAVITDPLCFNKYYDLGE